jgi:branched-chain amino acid aminotransferase
MVKDGVLKTPPLGRILSSITRKSIVQAAPAIGIPVSEDSILPKELFEADEIFTSHSGVKVSPVNRFEDRNLKAPGPVTQQVMDLMNNIINRSDDRFSDWFYEIT